MAKPTAQFAEETADDQSLYESEGRRVEGPCTFNSSSSVASGNFAWRLFFRTLAMYLMP